MVGVCIKFFHENYGGMLQAFATIKVLEAYGIEYELIRYEKKISIPFIIKSVPRLMNRILINDKIEGYKKKQGLKKHPQFAAQDAIRMEAFRKFKEEKFTKLSEIFYGYDELRHGAKKYRAVITGSDQLWSPAGLPTNFYNLMFVPDDIRKISYASSFGVGQIPWYQKNRTKTFLNRIEYIGMREKRGAEIVNELTGLTVPTILDPVFMFDQREWEQLIPVKKEFNEPYLFAYFLGSDSGYRTKVKEAAKILNCKIITLRHLDQYVEVDEQFGDESPYDVNPENFLNILRGAAYIFTDSFHGSVFSIIHSKQFVVFNRYSNKSKNSKNSRIDTLCDNLGLQRRRYHIGDPLKDQILEKIDYTEVFERLKIVRKDTAVYLESAFNGLK